MQKPSFWQLFVAYGIDILILWALNFGYYMWAIHSAPFRVPWPWNFLEGFIVFLVINAGYFAVLEWKGNGSLGKKIFDLKIQGFPLSFFRVFTAYGIECIFFFILIWGIIFSVDSATRKISMDVGIFITIASGWFFGPILICLYYSILEHKYGHALGKKLMGLTVVKDAPAGENNIS